MSVYERGKTKLIPFKDIIMLVSASNYSEIHLRDGEKLFTSKTLKHWSEKIDSTDFLRVHQSFYINLKCIRDIDVKQKRLCLSNGKEAFISRSKWSKVKAIILN